MPPGEVLWRIGHTLTDSMEALSVKVGYKGSDPTPLQGRFEDRAWKPPPGCDASPYVEAADKVLAGFVNLYGEWVSVGQNPEWNRDPIGGNTAPLNYGKLLDYRDVALVGSARNTWELNRHFQLVSLAQAWALTGDDRYRKGANDLLASWLAACPYPLGINWASSLEHGIRLINWYVAARLLDIRSNPLECSRACLDSIFRHCEFIWNNQSRFSSANNHLIGEMTGLYIASVAWPCWRESTKWRSQAKRILLREAHRQVHSDGVSREQTVGYQAFVLQFLIMAGLVGEAHDDPFPAAYWDTVRRMLTFLRSIMNAAGNVPDFGDSDDGMAYVLTPGGRQTRYRDLLEFESEIAGVGSRQAVRGTASDWLCAGFSVPIAWPGHDVIRRREFPEGGYYVLGGAFGERDEVSLVFDAAPLGYLSIAAHGHADCLSFVLSLGGRQILVDPGTYCYHSDPSWRDYFRSTSAHNTVRIDATDQSEIAGPFMWLRKAQPTMERLELELPIQVIRARHNGYTRLADPVLHTRELRLDIENRMLEVIDIIDCKGAHLVERFWHFDDSSVVERVSEKNFLITTPDARIEMESADCEATNTLCGSLAPKGGWISRAFGTRSPACTLVAKTAVTGPATLRTVIRWQISRSAE